MAARPASFYLLGLRFLEQLLDVSGLWWSGVHLPLWWSGLAQVGGAVWRRGGVDGWPNLGYALIPSEYVFAKDGGGDCWVCRTGLSSMRVNGRQVYTLGFLDEARRCVDKAADFNVEAAERGIIYIDEVDKLAKQVGCQEDWRDVSGEGVQQALLKIFEGTVINVPRKRSRDNTSDGYVEVDTKNILFICGGAFSDLGKIISERHRRCSFGFGTPICRELRDSALTNALEESSFLEDIENDDLIAYGLTPEFIGRLPITVGLTHLTEDQLVQVLREPKNAIGKQYKKLFKMNNVKLHVTENALRLIANKAAARETGARGLRSIMEGVLTEAMFEIPEAGEGKEKIIAVLVDEESVGPPSCRGCGAKIFRDDGALELYVYQNNIRVPGLIQGLKPNFICHVCLLLIFSAAKLWIYHVFHCFSSLYAWIVLILCKANIFT